MSDENKTKKKKTWIVKALIAFLVIMGILTFFSNTIMNMTLTQVSTQQIYPATLTSITRSPGTLHAKSEKQIKAPGELTIDDVPIYLYQEVEEGDTLATFNLPEEKADLEEAKKALEDLEKEMKYKERQPGSTKDYYQMEMDVVDAEKRVTQAEKNLQAAKNKESAIAQTKADINALKDQITQIEKDKANLETSKVELEQRRDAAYEKIEMAKESLTMAQENLAACITDPSDPAFDQAAIDAANAEVAAAQKEVETHQATYNKAVEDIKSVDSQMIDKDKAYTEKNTALETKTTDLAEFEQLSTVEEAERELKDAKHNLTTVKKTLSDTKTTDGIDADRAKDEADKKIKEKEDLEKKVKELEEYYAHTDIKAPFSGTVISINVSHGDQCSKDQVLFVIADMTSGLYVDCTIAKKDTEGLFVGSEVRADSCDTAVIEAIRPDPSDPMNSNIIRVAVTGSWLLPGAQTINCTISTSNRYYDNVVPKGAVQTDTEGSFIYILVTKNSPLGERYIARKVTVNVLAEDATSCAIEGAGVSGAYCIVRTEKPIKNGEQVRLAQGETN